VSAQVQAPPITDATPPGTRAAQIEAARKAKAASLEPDEAKGIEHDLNVIEDKELPQRFSAGVGGVRVHMGGLITGSGFAAGPEYYRHLLHDQLLFRTSVRASLQQYYLMDAELDAPRLVDNHVFANFYAVHYDYPKVDYYGEGSHSHKTGRTDFRLETTSFRLRTGLQPIEHLKIGVIGEYLRENVGPGDSDDFASADRVYSEQTTPGLEYQSNFLNGGGFVQYDWRDHPGGPRYGGNYIAEFSDYSDIRRESYSFNELHLEAQQYIPFFNRRRVIALRGRVIATDPHGSNRVPFYLQPTLGGSDDLRGYRSFRFYDNNSAVLNAEYRWEVFSGLDMALFFDAGQVFDKWQQINLRRLDTDYGFGFRFNVGNDVFLRIDTGFSREGFAIWFKFSNVF
jgi:outer membrane protein assembly factor BamA